MILLIGGAYQGMADYAAQALDCDPGAIHSLASPGPLSPGCRCLDHMEQWVRRCLEQGLDCDKALEDWLPQLTDMIVICEDIQCGVVPMDPLDRAWREANGRCLCRLAQEADSVIRLCCGLPLILK